MHSMKVIVLGTGAIGTYYGGQLARAGHAVTCFARGANLAAIQERGLEIRTPEGAFRARVSATARLDSAAPADFAILAVKSYSLVDIAPIVPRCAEQGTAVGPSPVAARNRGNRCRGARTRHRPPRGGGRARARRDRWPAAGDEAQLPGRPRDRRADGAGHSQRGGFPFRGRGGYRHADPRHGGGPPRPASLVSS